MPERYRIRRALSRARSGFARLMARPSTFSATAGDHEVSSVECPPRARLASLAAANAGALVNTSTWFHRRVERITFTDRLTVLRRISVDFTIHPGLKPFSDATDDQGRKTFYVPVALLRRWPPVWSFDLRDDEDLPIPRLTSKRTGLLDQAALEALAPDGDLKQQVLPLLREIPVEPREEAHNAMNKLSAVLLEKRTGMTTPELEQWSQVLVVAAALTRNMILWVRVQGRPNERHIVKWSYEEPLEGRLILRRRLLAALSWSNSRWYLQLANVGERASFHFELSPPKGLEIRTVRLGLHPPGAEPGRGAIVTAADAGTRAKRYAQIAATAVRNAVMGKIHSIDSRGQTAEIQPEPTSGDPWYWNAGTRAYVYLAESRQQFGLVVVEMALESRGFVATSLVASLAVAALMTAFAIDVHPSMNSMDADVAVLILVPALLGLLVARADEHPITTRHAVGVRALVAAAGSVPVLAAAALLVANGDSDAVRPWWIALATISWVIALCLVASWLLPAEHQLAEPPAPTREIAPSSNDQRPQS